MLGQAEVAAADCLIPPDRKQSCKFFFFRRVGQQEFESFRILLREIESGAIVMLALRRAEVRNVNNAAFRPPEKDAPALHAAPGVSAIPAHSDFGDLREHACGAVHLGNRAGAAPDNRGCIFSTQLRLEFPSPYPPIV